MDDRVAGESGTSFTSVQQRIIERLSAMDAGLAHMYMGGLRVLDDAANHDRIAQSAHSIRESTYHLSNKGKALLSAAEAKVAKEDSVSNARQLERVFDPAGGARGLEDTAYDVWNSEFHQFFVNVSHHHVRVTLDAYRSKLAEFEEFLVRYILPLQVEIYDRIDECLRAGPESATPRTMHLLLSRNRESYGYFFRKASPEWLSFVADHKLLIVADHTKEFLKRAATVEPERVITILTGAKVPPEEWRARSGAIEVAGEMAPTTAAPLIGTIRQEHWFHDPSGRLVWYAAHEWLQVLLAAGGYQQGIELAQQLLAIDKAAGAMDVKPYLEPYATSEVLKTLGTMPPENLRRTIRCLVQLLGQAMKLEHPESTRTDSSWIWCPAIEEDPEPYHQEDFKHQLVTAIRALAERYLATLNPLELEHALGKLLQHEPSFLVFKRLKLYLLRVFAALCTKAIEEVVVACIGETKVWHEYALLVQAAYPTLAPTVRTEYQRLVRNGPTERDDERYTHNWKLRRLAIIRDHLTPDERCEYEALRGPGPDPEEPTRFVTEAAWVGPTAAHTPEELNGFTVDDLVRLLREWRPTEVMFGPSREGLGRSLSAAVALQPARYADTIQLFAELRPVYLYHLLIGLRNGARTILAWEPIIGFGFDIVERAQHGSLDHWEAASEEDWEPKWDAVFQELAALIEVGLFNATSPPINERDRVWQIISYVCAHPDPTPEYEQAYGGHNLDPMTLSINTARGHGFHALFAYIAWTRANGEVGIPQEAKAVLEEHLEPSCDPSLTVRSVYGMHVATLFFAEEEWTRTQIPRMFPQDERDRWYTTWETYLLLNCIN